MAELPPKLRRASAITYHLLITPFQLFRYVYTYMLVFVYMARKITPVLEIFLNIAYAHIHNFEYQ